MIKTLRTTALIPALMLGGCLSFGGEPPASLLTLTSTATAPAGTGAQGTQASALALVEFDAPAALDVTRVPVQVTDTEIAYLQDAVWVDEPARLFTNLVAETIRARSGRVVVEADAPGVLATDRLSGVVREFGYHARTSEVVVRFDAIMAGEGSEVRTRRFEARVPGVAADVAAVGPALNQAANEVAGQVADWVG